MRDKLREAVAKPEDVQWLLDAANQVIKELGEREHLDSDTFRWLCNATGQVERDLKRAALAASEPSAEGGATVIDPQKVYPPAHEAGDAPSGQSVTSAECLLCAKGVPLDCTGREHRVNPAHGETFVGPCTQPRKPQLSASDLRAKIEALRRDMDIGVDWSQSNGSISVGRVKEWLERLTAILEGKD